MLPLMIVFQCSSFVPSSQELCAYDSCKISVKSTGHSSTDFIATYLVYLIGSLYR